MAGIADRLGSGACRLLTLLGPGGCGKTHLALEAAARQIDHHEDGVFFVSLAAARSAGAVIGAIAQALGIAPPGGNDLQRDARRRLLDHLRRKRLLLVLDSFEHLLDGSGRKSGPARQVPGAAPSVRLLATSRARLNLTDEHLLPISGLDFPRLCEETAPMSGLAPMGGVGDEPAGTPESLLQFGAVRCSSRRPCGCDRVSCRCRMTSMTLSASAIWCRGCRCRSCWQPPG